MNDDEAYYNNGLPSERKSPAKNNRPWQTILDGIVSDPEDIDIPIFSKFRRSGKARKVKSRRQLPSKSQIRRKTTKPTENKVTEPFAHEPPILRGLFSGNGRLPYAFNHSNKETMQAENSVQTFREAATTHLGNAAPIMYDFTDHHTKKTTVENEPDQQVDQQDKKPTASIINYKHDELMEPHTLPLRQPEDDKWTKTDKGANSLEGTNISTIIHEYNYNSNIWKGFEGLDDNRYDDRMSRFTTERTDVADILDEQKLTDMSDYVIDDPTPREYDTEDVGSEEEEDKHGITDERQDTHGITDERQNEHGFKDETQDDFEPTAEMKRIMNWFPRSRLLTTENNGYKLFPGVSE